MLASLDSGVSRAGVCVRCVGPGGAVTRSRPAGRKWGEVQPNPFAGLLHSRKFWLAILDAVVSTALYFVGKYAGAHVDDLRFIIAVYQPVIGLVIVAITVEDTAKTQAKARVDVAEAQSSAAVEVAAADNERRVLLRDALAQSATLNK